jgi:hypothetical protein
MSRSRFSPICSFSAPVLSFTSLAVGSLSLTSCGFLDAYKSHEKRCKANCDSNSADGSDSKPFNFDLTYWNQTTPRSQLDPNTELVPLIRSNPFKLIANALKTVSDDISEAKQALSKNPPTAQSECLKSVFTAAMNKSAGRSEASLDYGNCVDLRSLEERLNSNRNTTKDGKLKIIDLSSALHFVSLGQLPLAAGGDGLQDANTGLDITTVLPFRTVRASDVANPSQSQTLKFHFVRGSVQGTALERTASSTILKKSWGLLYVGLDERQPLITEWSPEQNRVRLSGSVATLSASFQRPASQTQWEGFGYSREFIFADFSISSPTLELNSQFGWSEQASLAGSYFLRINGDLVEAGGDKSRLFHLKGLGRPCTLEVGLVTGFQGETPVEQPLGQVSICSAAN